MVSLHGNETLTRTLIKRKILQDATSILNIYAPNVRAPIVIKITKSYITIELNTLLVEDFNTLFSPINKSLRQKLNREITKLTKVMIQMDLTDICKHFIQTQKNIPSSQHFMEPSPKYNWSQSKPQKMQEE